MCTWEEMICIEYKIRAKIIFISHIMHFIVILKLEKIIKT